MSKTIQDLFRLGMDREIPEVADYDQLGDGVILNLGSGNKIIPGDVVGLDLPQWNADKDPIPYPDGSVALIHAYHFLEHLQNPVAMLRECQRVLKPGGLMNVVVPYYTSQMMAHDLTHKHAFCEDTWKITFRNPYYKQASSPEEWKLEVKFNVIIGIVERNLCLMTQLIRMP
jgi:SAM-dependent methyltransferase